MGSHGGRGEVSGTGLLEHSVVERREDRQHCDATNEEDNAEKGRMTLQKLQAS